MSVVAVDFLFLFSYFLTVVSENLSYFCPLDRVLAANLLCDANF